MIKHLRSKLAAAALIAATVLPAIVMVIALFMILEQLKITFQIRRLGHR